MAGVLVVAGVGVMQCVLGVVFLKSPYRSGRRRHGVRMLRLRVSHRGGALAMRRLAMFRCNTLGGRHWFGVIVMRRMLRLVSMRSMLARHAPPLHDRNWLAGLRCHRLAASAGCITKRPEALVEERAGAHVHLYHGFKC